MCERVSVYVCHCLWPNNDEGGSRVSPPASGDSKVTKDGYWISRGLGSLKRAKQNVVTRQLGQSRAVDVGEKEWGRVLHTKDDTHHTHEAPFPLLSDNTWLSPLPLGERRGAFFRNVVRSTCPRGGQSVRPTKEIQPEYSIIPEGTWPDPL